MMVKYLSGDNMAGMRSYLSKDTNALFVNERMCFDDWYQGFLSINDYARLIKTSSISFVRDEIDPEPQRKLEKLFDKRRFRRFVRNAIRARVRK